MTVSDAITKEEKGTEIPERIRRKEAEGQAAGKKDYNQTAECILDALENSKTPISWHEINRPKLKHVIAQELARLDREGIQDAG